MSAQFTLIEQHPEGRYLAQYFGSDDRPVVKVDGPRLNVPFIYGVPANSDLPPDVWMERAIREALETIVRQKGTETCP